MLHGKTRARSKVGDVGKEISEPFPLAIHPAFQFDVHPSSNDDGTCLHISDSLRSPFYLALIISSAALAFTRLLESTEIPGCNRVSVSRVTVEFRPRHEPVSHLGWIGMATIVAIGLGLNALLLQWLARLFELHHGLRM